MEVTPEMYAWLTDLNIINPFSSLKSDVVGNFVVHVKDSPEASYYYNVYYNRLTPQYQVWPKPPGKALTIREFEFFLFFYRKLCAIIIMYYYD